MAPTRRRWNVRDPIPRSVRSRFSSVVPLMAQLLYNRGIITPDAADSFLFGAALESNPFQMKDMPKAVARLRRAVKEGDRIAIYGDFDVDGVAGTALLSQTLGALGAQVCHFIPDRVVHGYGLHVEALRDLYRQGARVLITVDCGIRAVSQIDEARHGLDIIVTDHHQIGPDLPPALAVINPKRPDCAYPFKELAGAGVAFQLARALLRADARAPIGQPASIDEQDLLDLVALGTVADIVPLLGENRILARRGLECLSEPRRVGLQALLDQAGARPRPMTAATIAFYLGPRLNAAGRLGSAELSYQLLTSTSREEAQSLAEQLESLNQDRRHLTDEALGLAKQQTMMKPTPHLLFAAHESFHTGVVGLVASRLVEESYRPAVVVYTGGELSRGSARSIPEFDIGHALDECADLLERHGGHSAAGGFVIRNEQLPSLRDRLLAIADRELSGADLIPTMDIDLEVELGQVDWATEALVKQIEPCGQGNPRPRFLSRGVQVRDERAVGRQERHLQLRVSDGRAVWHAIGFGLGDLAGHLGQRVDIVYAMEANEWQDESRLQLLLEDVRPSRQEARTRRDQ